MEALIDSPAITAPSSSGHDYSELRSKLQQAIRRTCPRWLADQREDLVQCALVRILKSYPDAHLNTSFLVRVAHSVVVDEIRLRRRRHGDQVGATPSAPDRVRAPATTSPEAHVTGQQVGAAIIEALADLSDDRRRAVTLHLQGHTVPEAAQLLGFARKKTENLVYRGLADLRDVLRDRGVEP